MSILKLAYINVIRRKSQSTLTMIISLLITLTFVLVISIFSIIQGGLKLSSERLGADILVIPNEANINSSETLFTGSPQPVYMSKNIEDKIKNINGIEKITPQFFTNTISDAGCCSYSEDLRIVGVDQNSDFILKPWFKQNNINLLQDNEIIIGSKIKAILGNKVSILSHPFKVVGTLYNTGSGMDNTIFMNIDKARLLAKKNFSKDLFKGDNTENLISSILIKVKTGSSTETIVKNINNLNLDVKATSTNSSIKNMKTQLLSFSKIILFLWICLLLTSSLALIGRFNALVKDRQKELGFLKAVGLSNRKIFKLVIFEGLIMAGISGILGSILAILLINPTLSALSGSLVISQGSWSFSSGVLYILIGLLFAFLLTTLSCLYPAFKVSKMMPREIISKGDVL